MQDYHEFLEEILISESELQKRVSELAEEIDRDYLGEDLHLVCILRGGVLFLADLMRNLNTLNTVDFMAVSSYGAGARQTTGQVRIRMDLQEDINNRNVLLVEDIVDSGYTLASVLEFLQMRHPKSLKVCALLDKPERREQDVPIHYRGFAIPNKFVFGYGLDIDEYYRNLRFIGAVNPERYQPPE
ncbi:MAG TPA: hypoxanthine phosphoribosyltransferase [Anaerolineales bacterium]|nr:hypoxanthine phosphoribosyltransferase [Anaerolineales bacterium]